MSVVTVNFELEGVTPLSFSKAIQSEKSSGESHEEFEARTWRERLHVDKDGICYVPPMMMKRAIEWTAKYMSETIPGKGKKTWTQKCVAGIMCVEPLSLGVKAEDVAGEWLHIPSDGQPGGSKRVWKKMPFIDPGWKCQGQYLVVDQLLTEPRGIRKIQEYLAIAGQVDGLGRFAPRRGGYYGRFKVTAFDCPEIPNWNQNKEG